MTGSPASRSVVSLASVAILLAVAAACGGADAERERAKGGAPAAASEDSDDTKDTAAPRGPDVIYVPTPLHIVERMLALADVDSADVLYDLGSGDGRIVVEAARRGARAVGIDIDPARVAEGRRNAAEAGVTSRAEFRQGDLFATDLRSATAVTLYLLPTLNVKLRPKLFDELRPGTPVVSHNFPMADWIPDSTLNIRGSSVFLWHIPVDVSGEWSVQEGNGAEVDTLWLDQRYQQVSGTLKFGGRTLPISRARLRGVELSFTVADPSRGGTTRRYEGVVGGAALEGTLSRAGGRSVPVRAVRASPAEGIR